MSTQNVVDMYQNDQVTRRYSEGFKLKILSELSTGKYTKRELSRIYSIQNYLVPLDVKITYRTWNQLHSSQSGVSFEFILNEPGSWEITINN